MQKRLRLGKGRRKGKEIERNLNSVTMRLKEIEKVKQKHLGLGTLTGSKMRKMKLTGKARRTVKAMPKPKRMEKEMRTVKERQKYLPKD